MELIDEFWFVFIHYFIAVEQSIFNQLVKCTINFMIVKLNLVG